MTIFFSFIANPVFSQNSPPQISNLSALADTVYHELTIVYDVSDSENDTLEILLSASPDEGALYNLNTDNAIGDIGFPVLPGTGKRITWYYPDSMSEKISAFAIKLAADDHAIDIAAIVNQIDTNRLKQNAQFITGIRHYQAGSAHWQEVRDSLLSRFQQNDLQTREQSFPYGNVTGKNIVGRKAGLVSNTKTFIVDGHYDTVVNSPGADDNASAIAGILEIIRVIAGLDFAYAVDFIAFDLEEHGLLGSKAFVANGMQPDEDIAGVINMDMIGYYTNVPNSQTVPDGFNVFFPDLYQQLVDSGFKGNFIISTANAPSNSLLKRFEEMANKFVPALVVGSVPIPDGIILEDALRSDHAPFWSAGYKALHLSDGAETRNPNYHKPSDVESILNYAFMSNVTKAVAATVLSLIKPLHADIQTVQVEPDPASEVWELNDSRCRWRVMPNPSDGKMRISVRNCGDEPLTLKLVAPDGKMIDLRPLNFHDVEIDFRDKVKTGYYYLELMGSRGAYSSRQIFIE